MNYQVGGYSGSSGYSAGGGYSGSHGYTMSSAGYSAGGSYAGSLSGPASYQASEQAQMSHTEDFLAENRPWTPIISNLGDVKEIVEQTFEKMTGQEFPHENIAVVICDEKQFRDIHMSIGGNWSPGIVGFSFNKYGKGTSEIYIKQDHMDSVLLTIGHELGHVLGPTLPNGQDEEAKAHAFSLAWIETIRDNNIGGLQPNIAPNPAHNGLHDVAFDFVKYLLNTGSSSFDVFKTLAHGLTSIIAT
jgi:hypothetical protein